MFLLKLSYLQMLDKNNYINRATKFTIPFKLLYLTLASVTLLLSQPQRNNSVLQKSAPCLSAIISLVDGIKCQLKALVIHDGCWSCLKIFGWKVVRVAQHQQRPQDLEPWWNIDKASGGKWEKMAVYLKTIKQTNVFYLEQIVTGSGELTDRREWKGHTLAQGGGGVTVPGEV